ncbi:hypothetical protein VTO73DRAFT_8280 [Trametes versicolor]
MARSMWPPRNMALRNMAGSHLLQSAMVRKSISMLTVMPHAGHPGNIPHRLTGEGLEHDAPCVKRNQKHCAHSTQRPVLNAQASNDELNADDDDGDKPSYTYVVLAHNASRW